MYKDLDAYWMPFTANRQFKKAPRMLAKAAGMHFWTPEGRQVLDGSAGLSWLEGRELPVAGYTSLPYTVAC